MSRVSVIILTRDRLPKLRACLDALLPQFGPEDEALIIDTGSSDGTVAHFASPPPRVKFLSYTGEGSWAEARNFGVQNAQGECIAFLDDDCVPATDWIARGKDLLSQVEAAGGYVEPGGISHWPEWWDARMGWLVGLSVPGHLGEYAGSYFYPYTSNLWVRAELARAEPFQQLGGEFGENDGKRYLMGREDAEWWRRIRVKGHFTKFDAELRVAHFIEPERLTKEYLTERARRDGEAWAKREGCAEDLEPIAYQIWRWQYFDRKNDPLDHEADSPPAYQRMMLARNRAALTALSEKISAADPHGPGPTSLRQKASLRAGRKFAFDRARTIARRIALAFSPTPKWKPPTKPPNHLIVAPYGHVGDLLILQSFLRGLLATYPDLKLDLLGSPSAHILLEPLVRSIGGRRFHLHAPDRKFRVDQIKTHFGPMKNGAIVIAPYLHDPWGEALVDGIQRLRTNAPGFISFDRDTGLSRMLSKARIQKTIHKDFTIHETENLRRLFGLGTDPPIFDAEPLPPILTPNNESLQKTRAWRDALPASAGERPLLLLNPDAAFLQKEWTEDCWAVLVECLLHETDCLLAINLSRKSHSLAAVLESKFPRNPRIAPLTQWSLQDLIALMSQSRAVITVDSAPQHLAHALNIPSLTLYGPMDERRWADRWKRPIHRTIRGGMFDLTPEERRGLPENHLMRLISPERVLKTFMELLASLPAHESGTSPR